MIDTIPVLEAVEEQMDEESLVQSDEHSVLGLAELLLKDRVQVDRLTRDDSRQPELIPRFLVIALTSFSLFSVAMIVLLNVAPAAARPSIVAEEWNNGPGSALSLWGAYALGLVAATGICLPSFYFYGLLAGVKISMLQVTTHVLKGKASTAIMLLGVLPIYVAAVLGMLVFGVKEEILRWWLGVGLVLPFLAGLWGVRSIYLGFLRLADTLPVRCRERRACFLRRLTLAWAACYTAVTPVMILTLWHHFAGAVS